MDGHRTMGVANATVSPGPRAALQAWQERQATMYSQSLQYFETDRLDLLGPMHSGGPWLRILGIQLPPEVLGKFYHTNAERPIPGSKSRCFRQPMAAPVSLSRHS